MKKIRKYIKDDLEFDAVPLVCVFLITFFLVTAQAWIAAVEKSKLEENWPCWTVSELGILERPGQLIQLVSHTWHALTRADFRADFEGRIPPRRESRPSLRPGPYEHYRTQALWGIGAGLLADVLLIAALSRRAHTLRLVREWAWSKLNTKVW